jgi:predicted permease
MPPLRQLLFRLQPFFRRRKIEAELSEEMRTHIEMQTEANLAAGMPPEEARCAARREFGGVDQVKERYRDERSIPWIEDLLRDVRQAFRQLAKSPGFTAIAILSLALGIGANVAIFSLINAALLRSLPVPNPQELRLLNWSGADPKVAGSSGNLRIVGRENVTGLDVLHPAAGERTRGDVFTYPLFRSLREEVAPVAEVVGLSGFAPVTVRIRAESFIAVGNLVSGNFFSGLGVQPAIGRLFTIADENPGGEPNIVISWDWWERYFDRSAEVVGQAITLKGHVFTVIGVTPQAFLGPSRNSRVAFYLPLEALPLFQDFPSPRGTDYWWVELLARVRPGVSATQLKTALDRAFAGIAADAMTTPRIEIEPGAAGSDFAGEYYRKPLMILLGCVTAVILLACANFAGLALARAAGRQHECAVRAALGCGRWRLIRESLTETFVLALAGGGLGVLMAQQGQSVVARLLGLWNDNFLDLTVLEFGLAATLATALFAGFLPAWRMGNINPLDGLKSNQPHSRPQIRTGRVLVSVQIAVSLLLVAGAGLYGRTLLNLVRIDPGFPSDHLLLVRISPGSAGYSDEALTPFFDRVREALASLPSVRNVTLSNNTLLSGYNSTSSFEMPARPPASRNPGTWPRACQLTVGEAFFETLGIPIVLGRSFTSADTAGAPRAVVVNETLARRYFGDEPPLGQVLKFGSAEWTVIGVSRDARYMDIRDEAPAIVYFSFRQSRIPTASFALRTAQPPLSLVPAARKAVAAIDPNVPLLSVTTQEAARDETLRQERMFAALVGALAGVAVLLACIGLYGLLAYNVARRTSEFGIRSALGAQSGDIARSIVYEALGLAAGGIAIGVPAAIALAQIIRNQLYGVAPSDPLTFISGALLLLVVAALAAWLPARRATKVNPLVALRAE